MNILMRCGVLINIAKKYVKLALPVLLIITGKAYASQFSLDIISTLNYIQSVLSHVGPMLSAVLFIIAGIFYAVGQLLPPSKRALFHATTIDIIMGAIIVAVLSVASNGLAVASTHLLTNITINSTV